MWCSEGHASFVRWFVVQATAGTYHCGKKVKAHLSRRAFCRVGFQYHADRVPRERTMQEPFRVGAVDNESGQRRMRENPRVAQTAKRSWDL